MQDAYISYSSAPHKFPIAVPTTAQESCAIAGSHQNCERSGKVLHSRAVWIGSGRPGIPGSQVRPKGVSDNLPRLLKKSFMLSSPGVYLTRMTTMSSMSTPASLCVVEFLAIRVAAFSNACDMPAGTEIHWPG